MITIIEGVPGSGKTYFAVFKTVEKLNRIKYTKINIITNIENFQVNDDRVHLTTFETQEELFRILNVDYFKENYTFNYEYNFIIVDECQRYFYKMSNKDVLFFLQYHRHLNCDIFLITQTMRSLPSEIVFLAESFVEAIPRSFTLKNIFRYNVRDIATKEVIDRFTLPVKSEIFSMYRSAHIENTDRKNFFHQKIFISIAIFAAAILLLLYSFYSIFYSKKQEYANKQQNQTQKQQTK
ncbi:MAG: zonular occludens toxin domain-containing protein, partial [Sulfurihydrogenibium azorense]|uniref:zonular occludens toxin domain-containing protein n=1 Tax=Sulfurihydrogenibium azorense TaxID=309806 RepID=UPI00391DD1B6